MELASLLGPVSTRRFVDEYLGTRFLHVPGEREKFAHLLRWAAVNDILRHHHLAPPRVRLTKNGNNVSSETFVRKTETSAARLVSEAFTTSLRDGATLIINGIDELHEPITDLAQRLERQLEVRVNVNMYAAWRSEQGFDLHWDEHDVFVLQVAGKKDWKVFPPTERFPLTYKSDPSNRPPSDPCWAGELIAGDAIYIPRGWWHVAVPCDEPTLHLTVGFRYPTGVDLMHWLIGKTAQFEAMRMDIPLKQNDSARDKYIESTREVLTSIFSGDCLSEFQRFRRSVAAPRPAFGLPWSAMGSILPDHREGTVVVMAPYDLEFRQCDEDGTVAVSFDGRVFTFHEATKPLFELLSGKTALRISLLYDSYSDAFSSAHISEFLMDLVKYGIVTIVRDYDNPEGHSRANGFE